MKKILLLLIFIILEINLFGQTIYKSSKYPYQLEIPVGFQSTTAVSASVDLKVVDGINSIVVLVKQLPSEAKGLNYKELYGDDLSNFKSDWLSGASEHFENPVFVKQGETTIGKQYTFWYDFTTKTNYDDYSLYSRNYQVIYSNVLYTFTLTCKSQDVTQYAAVWYRFMNSIKFN